MKTKKERDVRVYDSYTCEICGKNSYDKDEILRCEKSHTCEHTPRYEFRTALDDGWHFNVAGIYRECAKCWTSMGEINFEDVEDSQEILAEIYHICEKKKITKEKETHIYMPDIR